MALALIARGMGRKFLVKKHTPVDRGSLADPIFSFLKKQGRYTRMRDVMFAMSA
jgi:hypothetical protein